MFLKEGKVGVDRSRVEGMRALFGAVLRTVK